MLFLGINEQFLRKAIMGIVSSDMFKLRQNFLKIKVTPIENIAKDTLLIPCKNYW